MKSFFNSQIPNAFIYFGELANQISAHSDYDKDERVVQIIAHGVGTPMMSERVQQRCEWLLVE